MTRGALLLSLLYLSGCVPMVASVYEPAEQRNAAKDSFCGWPSVTTPLLSVDSVSISIATVPSSGIGVHQLYVNVSADAMVSFKDQRLKIESPELASPVYSQFGTYNRGVYGAIGVLKGPINQFFFIQGINNIRPKNIEVTLPEIEINGRTIQPPPAKFTLNQKPVLAGLCQ